MLSAQSFSAAKIYILLFISSAIFYARFNLLAQMGPQKTSAQMNVIS